MLFRSLTSSDVKKEEAEDTPFRMPTALISPPQVNMAAGLLGDVGNRPYLVTVSPHHVTFDLSTMAPQPRNRLALELALKVDPEVDEPQPDQPKQPGQPGPSEQP